MAIHSKYLEALEAVIATALNIVKNRKRGARRTRRHASKDAAIIPL
jgi:hypothetical protein